MATDKTNQVSSQQEPDDDDSSPPPSFVESLPEAVRQGILDRLDAFLVAHVPHRPVALVTSGGTAVDLEKRAVRSLENFSTGYRGAVAAENLLRLGYAVVFMQRQGSTSPFARIVVEECGSAGAAHQGLTLEAMDALLARPLDEAYDNDDADDDNDDGVKNTATKGGTTGSSTDPWLTGARDYHLPEESDNIALSPSDKELHLQRALVHSGRLQKAVRERIQTKRRLLTVTFRTVQDYLANLELCSTALQATAGPQALLLLAAAVSDFYVPDPTEHKIQSQSTSKLILELEPVPKTLGILRRKWAPDAFTVSFKLETDESILYSKAQGAMQKYGVHMVVGNILNTRYDQVHLLYNADDGFVTLDKPSRNRSNDAADKQVLEEMFLQAVVEAHFAHIAGQGVRSVSEVLRSKQQRLARKAWWQRGRQLFMEVAGVTISLLLSYGINRLILRQQHRIRG